MALVKYDPFRVRGLQKELDELMQDFFGRPMVPMGEYEFAPSVDVYEDAKAITVRAELPGIDQSKVSVNLENGVLTLSGLKEEFKFEKEPQWHIRETQYGAFSRQISLPEFLNPEKASANYRNGILEIRIEKREEARPRAIEVKVE